MVWDRHQEDLYVRPSWLDAGLAFKQIEKGKAQGNRCSLWFRSRVQKELFQLGCFIQRHAGKVLFVSILLLATFCVGLKSAVLHSRVDQLWIEEGGRLERELRYVESALGESAQGGTHQLIIQTPKDASANLLHSDALLAHLKTVKAASAITVHMFNVPWKLKDICASPGFSSFDVEYIDRIFQNIIPCSIITPLDCFWEGSKLLGPDFPVTVPGIPYKLKWTSISPLELLNVMKNFSTNFPLKTLEETMKRAGVTTGYQEKPCLNPRDKECPATAPNKNSTHRLDIGAELTGGCYGFASKYMHWPEDLIVGGAYKNKSGHIQKARSLQTVIQLMGEKELFNYYAEDYKVHQIDWTPYKAAQVLEGWQRKFSEEIKKLTQSGTEDVAQYNVFTFCTVTLNDILSHYSKLDAKRIIIGYLIMLVYVGISLLRWNNPVLSQSAVGIAGVILVCVTIAAALGVCAVLGIPFNVSTTQVVPFLGLGLGVFDMLLLTSAYSKPLPSDTHPDDQMGIVLRKGGSSLLLSSLSNASAFLAASIVPIPALRAFSLQVAVLIAFNLLACLLVFPAIVSIDLKRRRSGRVDVFCCCCILPANGNWPCLEPETGSATAPGSPTLPYCKASSPFDSRARQHQLSSERSDFRSFKGLLNEDSENWSLTDELRKEEGVGQEEEEGDGQEGWQDKVMCKYARLVCRRWVKVVTTMALTATIAVSLWNVTNVVDGLDLSDVVPRATSEFAFLDAQQKYYGFYNMYAVTQGDFEYPTNQKLLYEYHDSFTRVPNIIKNDNGGLPPFWLSLFRDWLLGLQKAFDKDWNRGCITQERWYTNASDEGILAYKLLAQTGYVENPVDNSLVTQNRLVDADGQINADAFYNYLSAWVCNDALAFGASQANLKPEPKQWCHVANDYELKIPKSSPLIYAQMPFYLRSLADTSAITRLITQVRALCQRFEARGLPNFPTGIPFLFWEQYVGLREYTAVAVACALFSVFCVVFVLLFNFWVAAMVVVAVVIMLVQLFGAFAMAGIKLNAVPAVLLVIAVGLDVQFVVHTTYSFLSCIGDRNRRLQLAMKHTLPTILHAAFATLFAIITLAFNDFHFIVRYFFTVLVSIVAIGLLNGLLFFPVLLLLFGPAAEMKPYKYADRMGTPSPPIARRERRSSYRVTGSASSQPPPNSRRHREREREREPSLSTITEEPGSWHSTTTHTRGILVEPELVLETTTFTHQPASEFGAAQESSSETNATCSSTSEPCNVTSTSTGVGGRNQVTTKVTATAKFKVEVHTTPVRHSHSHSRRRDSTSHMSTSTSTLSTDFSTKH